MLWVLSIVVGIWTGFIPKFPRMAIMTATVTVVTFLWMHAFGPLVLGVAICLVGTWRWEKKVKSEHEAKLRLAINATRPGAGIDSGPAHSAPNWALLCLVFMAVAIMAIEYFTQK